VKVWSTWCGCPALVWLALAVPIHWKFVLRILVPMLLNLPVACWTWGAVSECMGYDFVAVR
jgi:hypothetical protein